MAVPLPDTVFHSGPVFDGYRLHDDCAVGVRSGRIVAVGDTENVVAQMPSAERVDLAGRLLHPGFTDAHVHALSAGVDRNACDLTDADTAAQLTHTETSRGRVGSTYLYYASASRLDDQERLLKQVLEAENVDVKRWTPKTLAGLVDHWKNRGWTPDKLPPGEDFANGKGQGLYAAYQARLRTLNACDFGDLLLHNITILSQHADLAEEYRRRFRYILVDEYQDTNVAQYLWLRLLAQRTGQDGARNVCCVGDDDQSIYGWRGAEVDNILRFEKDFPGAVVIRLERNYRSTAHILGAAGRLIAHNEDRLGKTLFTERADPEELTALRRAVEAAPDGRTALRLVADQAFDLAVMDVMLPDMDGFTVTRTMRGKGHDVPVLFLTARDAVQDKVKGLTVGGDDYVTKPFSLEEVVARIRAVLRRTGSDTAERATVTVADLELDDDSHEVRRDEMARAAEILGISIRTLRNKLAEYRDRGLAVPPAPGHWPTATSPSTSTCSTRAPRRRTADWSPRAGGCCRSSPSAHRTRLYLYGSQASPGPSWSRATCSSGMSWTCSGPRMATRSMRARRTAPSPPSPLTPPISHPSPPTMSSRQLDDSSAPCLALVPPCDKLPRNAPSLPRSSMPILRSASSRPSPGISMENDGFALRP